MPINMACPSCGKTLAAPDSAAGKRAKCPACGQIMVVPTAASQTADGFAPPLETAQAAFGAPSSGGGENSRDQFFAADQAAAPTAVPGSEVRRPCPECGEMIVAGAVKCRFCGAVFDSRLRTRGGKSQNGFAIASLVLGILGLVTGCFGIVFGVVAAVFGFLAMNGMKQTGSREGRGMAVTGVVLGIIAAVGWTLIYAILFTVFAGMRQHNFPPPNFH